MFDEFVVTNVVSIVSENVTEMVEVTETEVSLSEGDVEETVGGVVSSSEVVVVVVLSLDVDAPSSLLVQPRTNINESSRIENE